MMNEKYIVKMEAGNMEQTFKIQAGEDSPIKGIADIDARLTPEFMSAAIERFNALYLATKQAGF